MPFRYRWLFPLLCLALLGSRAHGDGAECNGWGEFRGIRIDGQLLPFSTSVKMANSDWSQVIFAATQTTSNPSFSRNGDVQTSSASIGNNALSYRQTVRDIAPGVAKVTITATANRDLALAGTYYFVSLPADLFSGGTAVFITDNADAPPKTVKLDPRPAGEAYRTVTARGIRVSAGGRSLELLGESAVEFTIQRDKFIDTDYKMQPELSLPVDPKSLDRISIYFPLASGNMNSGQQGSATFTLKAAVVPDKTPLKLALDATHPGSGFDGMGGNFRLQTRQDQAHIDYNLEHLRVAWGRVEMPLAQWQPQEKVDPLATAPSTAAAPGTRAGRGGLGGFGGFGGRGGGGGPNNTSVRRAMEMAQTLAAKDIPFFISAWSIPQWASIPSPRRPDQPAVIQGGRFNPDKLPELYKAIGSYLTYLKNNYHAEPVAFSFNESDIGINVLFTPQEHADFIKGLGRYLESQGLKTRLMLADVASSHPLRFITPAMKDPECRKYICGVSFHTWRDGTDEEFIAWNKAARELNVPLYCGEGGLDAEAYRYPQVFAEPSYALREIQTYLRIMQYAQPASILHWQLTEDGSLLNNRNGTLTPTRRFYQLKQLDLTPPGAPFLPLLGDAPDVTRVAYGSDAKGYAIHLLNNGAQRQVTLTGLPASIKGLNVVVTDSKRQMKELRKISTTAGSAAITVDPESLTTLTSP